MSNPGKEHWNAVKWILRYLKGTSNTSADVDTSRSTSGYVMKYAGGAVSWQPRLQKTVALSTTEAEHMAAVEAGKEILWMKDVIGELGIRQDEYRLYCDSQCHPPCEECGVPL